MWGLLLAASEDPVPPPVRPQFYDDEDQDLPPPITLNELIRASKAQANTQEHAQAVAQGESRPLPVFRHTDPCPCRRRQPPHSSADVSCSVRSSGGTPVGAPAAAQPPPAPGAPGMPPPPPPPGMSAEEREMVEEARRAERERAAAAAAAAPRVHVAPEVVEEIKASRREGTRTQLPAAARTRADLPPQLPRVQLQVVKDYVRPRAAPAAAAGLAPVQFVVSPLTGEMVPVSEMAEHMRISLIDPRWRDQREAMLNKIKETTKASDDEIASNILSLARTRPDIFGSTQDEVGAIVKAEIESRKISGVNRPVAWDGMTRGGPGLQAQQSAIADQKAVLQQMNPPAPAPAAKQPLGPTAPPTVSSWPVAGVSSGAPAHDAFLRCRRRGTLPRPSRGSRQPNGPARTASRRSSLALAAP